MSCSRPAVYGRRSYVVQLTRTTLAMAEPKPWDPGTFVVETPMGRYSGVKEMIEMSKTPGEYKYPLTPLGSWRPSWL